MKNSLNIQLYGLFNVIQSLDFLAPIRIVYFQHVTNSYSQAASLISIVWIASAIFEVPTGIFSDFIGRKKTIIIGALCMCLAYILYVLGINFWILAIGAVFQGMARAFFSGNNNAYLYNSLEKDGREKEYQNYYGKISSFLSASCFIAALLSGVIAGWSFELMIWLSFVFQLISLIVAMILPEVFVKKPETTNIFIHLKEAIIEIKKNINLRYLSLSGIFIGAGDAAYEFHAAVFVAVWPLWAIGIARAFQELTLTISYYFSEKIIKRLGGAINTCVFQNIFSWVGSILAVVTRSVISPLFIISGFIFLGPSDTASQSLYQKEFTERQRATIASLNSLGASIYFTFVMIIAGFMANNYNPFIGLLVTQIFYLPAIYYRLKLFAHIHKTKHYNNTQLV